MNSIKAIVEEASARQAGFKKGAEKLGAWLEQAIHGLWEAGFHAIQTLPRGAQKLLELEALLRGQHLLCSLQLDTELHHRKFVKIELSAHWAAEFVLREKVSVKGCNLLVCETPITKPLAQEFSERLAAAWDRQGLIQDCFRRLLASEGSASPSATNRHPESGAGSLLRALHRRLVSAFVLVRKPIGLALVPRSAVPKKAVQFDSGVLARLKLGVARKPPCFFYRLKPTVFAVRLLAGWPEDQSGRGERRSEVLRWYESPASREAREEAHEARSSRRQHRGVGIFHSPGPASLDRPSAEDSGRRAEEASAWAPRHELHVCEVRQVVWQVAHFRLGQYFLLQVAIDASQLSVKIGQADHFHAPRLADHLDCIDLVLSTFKPGLSKGVEKGTRHSLGTLANKLSSAPNGPSELSRLGQMVQEGLLHRRLSLASFLFVRGIVEELPQEFAESVSSFKTKPNPAKRKISFQGFPVNHEKQTVLEKRAARRPALMPPFVPLVGLKVRIGNKQLILSFRKHQPKFIGFDIEIWAVNQVSRECFRLYVSEPDTVQRLVTLLDHYTQNYVSMDFVQSSACLFFGVKSSVNGRKLTVGHHQLAPVLQSAHTTREQLKYNFMCEIETIFIKNTFLRKEINFMVVTKPLGKVYVACTIFRASSEDSIILLVVQSNGTRFSSNKFIMHQIDLGKLLTLLDLPSCSFRNLSFRKVQAEMRKCLAVGESNQLVRMLSELVQNMQLINTSLYSKLKIMMPLSLQMQQQTHVVKPLYYFENAFNKNELGSSEKLLESLAQASAYDLGFLHKKLCHTEVVVKVTKRFNGQYWIVTVLENVLFDKIIIQFYLPSKSRTFQCNFTRKHDIQKLDSQAKYEAIRINKEIVWEFVDELIRKKFPGPPRKPPKVKINPGSQKQQYWMDVINYSSILSKFNKMFISLKGKPDLLCVLEEIYFQAIHETDKYYFEVSIYLEDKKLANPETRDQGVNDQIRVNLFESVPIRKLQDYSFLLKIIRLDKDNPNLDSNGHFQNDKFQLDELFKIYGDDLLTTLIRIRDCTVLGDRGGSLLRRIQKSDLDSWLSSGKPDPQPFDLELLRLIEVHRLSGIIGRTTIENLLKNWNSLYSSQARKNAQQTEFSLGEQMNLKEIIYGRSHFELKMKVNSKLKRDVLKSDFYRNHNDILLFRAIFTMHPKQLLVILFNQKGSRPSPRPDAQVRGPQHGLLPLRNHADTHERRALAHPLPLAAHRLRRLHRGRPPAQPLLQEPPAGTDQRLEARHQGPPQETAGAAHLSLTNSHTDFLLFQLIRVQVWAGLRRSRPRPCQR